MHEAQWPRNVPGGRIASATLVPRYSYAGSPLQGMLARAIFGAIAINCHALSRCPSSPIEDAVLLPRSAGYLTTLPRSRLVGMQFCGRRSEDIGPSVRSGKISSKPG
jgi:hypothetical protein